MRRTTGIAAAAVTCTAVIGLFAWDTQKTRGADGDLHGPYEAWQIACLVAVLLVVAVWSGLRDEPLAGAVAAAVGGFVGTLVTGYNTDPVAGTVAAAFAGLCYTLAVLLGVLGVAYLVRVGLSAAARERRG